MSAPKCEECDRPCRVVVAQDDNGNPISFPDVFSMHCSDACSAIAMKRGLADGSIIMVADMTPEQLGELFRETGLELGGVGPRVPS